MKSSHRNANETGKNPFKRETRHEKLFMASGHRTPKGFLCKEKNVTRIVGDGKILKYNVNEGLSKHRKNGKLFY